MTSQGDLKILHVSSFGSSEGVGMSDPQLLLGSHDQTTEAVRQSPWRRMIPRRRKRGSGNDMAYQVPRSCSTVGLFWLWYVVVGKMFQALDIWWYPLCNCGRCNCSSRRRVMMMLASSACARSCGGFVGFWFCARGRTNNLWLHSGRVKWAVNDWQEVVELTQFQHLMTHFYPLPSQALLEWRYRMEEPTALMTTGLDRRVRTWSSQLDRWKHPVCGAVGLVISSIQMMQKKCMAVSLYRWLERLWRMVHFRFMRL